MSDLQRILSGRLRAISAGVIPASVSRQGRKSRSGAKPGYRAMSAKLAKASEKVRGARHGRRTA